MEFIKTAQALYSIVEKKSMIIINQCDDKRIK